MIDLLTAAREAISNNKSHKPLTQEPSSMEPKKRRKTKATVLIGRGAATVRIYPITRKNGYPQNSVCWKEGGRRRMRCFACMDEAKMVAQQISVRLTNGWSLGDEVTRRDIEILRHCEGLARRHGVELVAAVEEWASARKSAGPIPLADAVRFYAANRTDIFPSRTVAQVADEFVESLRAKGLSATYVRSAKLHLKGFSSKLGGEIADVAVADINRYLTGLKTLGPVSKNGIRRNIVTMFGFAKRQGYLHPDRKTAAEQCETFKVHETEIQIFTPEEMEKLLLVAHARILPVVAIGAFAGIRSAEIQRLHWEDIKWDRGHIEISGRKAKTAARRLVPLTENLKAWLAPWREASGPIVPISDTSGSLGDLGIKAQIPGGWRQNALRHSFISYRVAETGDVPRTALEAGNSPRMIFRHYREVVDGEAAKKWFAIMPPEVWPPQDWRLRFRRK
jgi:integrase